MSCCKIFKLSGQLKLNLKTCNPVQFHQRHKKKRHYSWGSYVHKQFSSVFPFTWFCRRLWSWTSYGSKRVIKFSFHSLRDNDADRLEWQQVIAAWVIWIPQLADATQKWQMDECMLPMGLMRYRFVLVSNFGFMGLHYSILYVHVHFLYWCKSYTLISIAKRWSDWFIVWLLLLLSSRFEKLHIIIEIDIYWDTMAHQSMLKISYR